MKKLKEAEENEQKNGSENWIQVFLAAGGALASSAFNGVTTAQSAVMLPQLRDPNSFIKVTSEDESWIASLLIFWSLIGALVCGPLMDMFGRKKGIQLFFLFMTLGFGFTSCSQEVWHIFVGRSFCGFGRGFQICSTVYIAEISNKQQRSTIFAVDSAMKSFGLLVMFIVARFGPWYYVSAGFSLVSLVFFIAGFFTPESPPWLLKKNREANAIQSYRKLGKSEKEIQNEVKLSKDSTGIEVKKINLKILMEPKVWKPFVILSIFHLLGCASGFWDFSFYNIDFINSLDTTYNAFTIATILSCIRVTANSSVGLYFTAKVKRKTAVSISGFLMFVGTLGAAIYEYVYRNLDKTEKPMQLVPILCITLYSTSTLLGAFFLPWSMAGEMFPLEVRGVMSAVTFSIGTVLMFASVKLYIIRVSFLSMYGYLFSISGVSFALFLFGVFVLTETQNKTLREIEDGFAAEKKRLVDE